MFELPLTLNELSLLGLILLTFTCLLCTTIFLSITRYRLEKMIDEGSPFGFQYDILQNQITDLQQRMTKVELYVCPIQFPVIPDNSLGGPAQFGTEVSEPDPADVDILKGVNVQMKGEDDGQRQGDTDRN